MADIHFRELDPLNCPLIGTNLIEASAGTGKTYTITSLFLRLVLEKQLRVSEILVVTFTKAATEELRDRIRKRLRQALQAFSQGFHREDDFINELVKNYKDKAQAIMLFDRALRDFDEAAIFTIHGFCQRVLFENAFETAQSFDAELVTDEKTLIMDTVYDFWRKFFSISPIEAIDYFYKKGVSPDTFFRLADFSTKHPDPILIPRIEDVQLSYLFQVQELFHELKSIWTKSREEIRDLLLNAPLKGTPYGTTVKKGESPSKRDIIIDQIISHMDLFLSQPWPSLPLFTDFKKFTSQYISEQTRKLEDPPRHEFFNVCEKFREKATALEQELDLLLLSFKVKFLEFAGKSLLSTKKMLNVRTFGDLIAAVERSLNNTRGKVLCKAIRRKYKAALIDEFQDTDPLQYTIFKRVFGDDSFPLFLIGDPKQAIYGFRGAEIFTYMTAARNIENRYTLLKNWRSNEGVIRAINTLFSGRTDPFVFKEIPFVPGQAVKKDKATEMLINGRPVPSLNVWFLDHIPGQEPGRPIAKDKARRAIAGIVAAEISKLLRLGMEGKAFVGEEQISGRHVAVLVRQNTEAVLVKEALANLNVHSVIYSGDNLFDSREAEQMERILWAICEPENEGYVRAALITDILGVSGNELYTLAGNDTLWDARLSRFREYGRLWEQQGFMAMFRHLMVQEGVKRRLLGFPDGERRLTNILHLCEVLHKRAMEENLGNTALLKWFADQRDKSKPRSEEHQLRLETDEEAVKVLTIHKSKGLEFPIVFCPFAWDSSALGGKNRKKEPFITFHDQSGGKPALVLGGEESELYTHLAERELLSENLRLLYVALTRAKACCYLAWGNISGTETSALAYLLCGPDSSGVQVVQETSINFPETADELKSKISDFIDRSCGDMALIEPMPKGTPLPPTEIQPESLTCRQFHGSIPADWKICSFSSLVSDQDSDILAPGFDEQTPEFGHGEQEAMTPGIESGASGFILFPRGTRAGTFIHSLLEKLDFTQLDSRETRELIFKKLLEYGFDVTWFDPVFCMLKELILTPLDPKYPGLTIGAIENKDRLNELEFYFPLKPIEPGTLSHLFSNYTRVPASFGEQMERLTFSPSRGFMRGFIDMVFRWDNRFYLVDWKSNFLGPTVEFYHLRELKEIMAREFYFFQYYIYSIALHQYLKQRIPDYRYESHFGGVYYIFLRGINKNMGQDYGIYRDLPPWDFIQLMSENLIED